MNHTQLLKFFATILCIAFSCNDKNMNDDKKFRQLIHFSEDENWTGEPSGLVYCYDEYHLFYQRNPTKPQLGNISWGHAVSRDLLHWEKLPIAIPSDINGQIYPGSVVFDAHNSSGLGNKQTPPLIAFYTYKNDNEYLHQDKVEHKIELAYSLDKGRTWIKYYTPILKNIEDAVFHYPRVSWNNVSKSWLMTISIGKAIRFYKSTDCINWVHLSDFGDSFNTQGGWEGSDFFPLKVANSNFTKWVLLVSMNGGPANGSPAIRYFVGDFNGNEFSITQTQKLWVDYGKDNYAGMTFNDASNKRKIIIGWMNCWQYANQLPTDTWRGSMTFPRELDLVKEGNNYLLTSNPISELEELMQESNSIENLIVKGQKSIFMNDNFPQRPFILKLLFDNSNRYAIWSALDYGLRFKTKSGKFLSIGYRSDLSYFYIDKATLMTRPFSNIFEEQIGAVYNLNKPTTDWFILVDNSSVELFACGNRIAMTSLYFNNESFESIEMFAKSGSAKLLKATLINLRPK